MTIGEIKPLPFGDWLKCVNRYLEFCLDREAESFGGIHWEELHRRGVAPIEAAIATVLELNALSREETAR